MSRKAADGLSNGPVTLGEAVATAQRAGGGDVFAILFDERRRALILAVRPAPHLGRAFHLTRSVALDIMTGAILAVDVMTAPPRELN